MLTHQTTQLSVSPQQLQQWQSQSVLDMLCGKTLGQSFCDHFGIQDYLLCFERDPQRVMQYAQHYVKI